MSMSEHTWTQQNIASYVAGGLDAAERERLEGHATACEACGAALREARRLDDVLGSVFASIRPQPALEDRMIRSLRKAPRVRRLGQLAMAAAAVILIGAVGASFTTSIVHGYMPFSGELKAVATELGYYPPSGALVVRRTGSQNNETSAASTTAGPLDDLARATREQMTKPTQEPTSNSLASLIPDSNAGTSNRIIFENVDANGFMDRGDTALGAWIKKNTEGSETGSLLFGVGVGGSGGGRAVPGAVNVNSIDKATAEALGRDFASYRKTEPALTERSTPTKQDSKAEHKPVYTYRNDAPAAPAGAPQSAQAGEDRLGEVSKNLQGKESPVYFKPVDEEQPALKDSAELERSVKRHSATKASAEKKPSDMRSSGGEKATSRTLADQAAPQKPPEAAAPSPAPRKIIIRTGEIEFEIQSFDSAVATATRLINDIKGGFVATVNSEKLPNGKVRGSMVVRLPPEHLDAFVLDLRKELGKQGELKGLRIGSQDITKQYTDIESRLRAARAMEERLLQMIKSGQGQIKDLLAAEKELGVWRTRIEEMEGELRYYQNQVGLSTLTITLYEKEIRSPYAILETERVQMGIEVEDVEKAQRAALAAVNEAKGRVTKSELKQHAAGQYSAIVNFEVAPEVAGPLRDRLKQLGTVARLDVDRLQQEEGGSGRPGDAKIRQRDTVFLVSIYNLANVAPRETVHINLAAPDAEAAYKTILTRVEKSSGRVVTSNLNQQRNEQTRGDVQFEVKAAEAEAVLLDLKQAGDVMRLQVAENPDTQNVTKSKRGFNVQIWALAAVAPRETSTIQIATKDVPAGFHKLQEAVAKAKGRILNSQLNEQDRQNVTAQLDFEIRRAEESALTAAMSSVGDAYSRNVVRAQDGENVVDSKLRVQVSLINLARIPPRETTVLGIEVADVDHAVAVFSAQVNEKHGRVVESHVARERSGRVTGKLVYDVPLPAAPDLVDKFKGAGTLRVHQSSRNQQVPESDLATARIDVTLSNVDLIVPSDDGVWPQVRRGLSWSFTALAWSLSWVIVGVCVVLPWALVLYVAYRLVLRLRRRPATLPPAA
jgi:hypothetical protein